MKYLYNASGANQPFIKEFKIAENANLKRGEAVSLVNGNIVAYQPSAGLAGICAEDHTGQADTFHPRSNGPGVYVNVTPFGVYSTRAILLTAGTGSTATKMIFTNGNLVAAAGALDGSVLKLVQKAGGSTNADAIGTVRTISGSAGADHGVTVTSGGVAAAGDVYAFFPATGISSLAICADDSSTLDIASSSANGMFLAIDADTDALEIQVMPLRTAIQNV